MIYNRWIFLLVFGLLTAMMSATRVQASLPVPYAVVGCVMKGQFYSRNMRSARLIHPSTKAIEGKTVRIEGRLSPGNRFRATAVFIVADTCREELHTAYFRCNPCRTLPRMPQKMLPRRPGEWVNLPAEAIREFDNIFRRRR